MRYQIALIFIIMNLFILGQTLLNPTSYDLASVVGLTTDEVIKVLTQEQTDMYEKSLRHFLQDFKTELQKQKLSRQQMNKKIFQKIHSIHMLWIDLKDYMVNKLFKRFEMDQLGESFQAQIKAYPEDYFLTFEMYDLLFD